MTPSLPPENSPSLTRRRFLRATALTTGALAGPWAHWPQVLAQGDVTAEDQRKIEAALPAQAPVKPRKPRKLLIFDLNVGYGGHGSIRTANLAFTLMGQKTGAFETVVSRDPAVFKPESLRQFDAVFFNNTVGNCFTDPALRQSLVEFVYGGGGLMGVHGTSVAFTQWPGAIEDWPEFGLMIGARGANHRASDERVFVKLDDPTHPVNQAFGGQGFEFRDEFFRVHEPYSRDRVRVLLSIDTEKTDLKQGPAYGKLERADNDFALAWVRNYGRGRTFYCTIAHNPYVFWDPKMLQFYLAATQFVLGDLDAPTLPSAKLTPAMRAQEKLGWRLGLASCACRSDTLFNAIDKASGLGLAYLGASSSQIVSREIPKCFDGRLTEDELRQTRVKLDGAGVRLLTWDMPTIIDNAADWRSVFEFGRRIGIETLVCTTPPASVALADQFAREFGINFALTPSPEGGKRRSVPDGGLSEVLRLCQRRSERLGVHGDSGYWARYGLDPVKTIRRLGERLLSLDLRDSNRLDGERHDVPWGTGAGKVGEALQEIHRLGLKPAMFGLTQAPGDFFAVSEVTDCIRFFNDLSFRLSGPADR